MASQRHQQRVRDYIEHAREQGARLVLGGSDLPETVERGWYIRPTVFADVQISMRIAREEVFGPVLTVHTYTDEDHDNHPAEAARRAATDTLTSPAITPIARWLTHC